MKLKCASRVLFCLKILTNEPVYGRGGVSRVARLFAANEGRGVASPLAPRGPSAAVKCEVMKVGARAHMT